MNKFKLFLDNFLVYGFGGIMSKVVPLIMIPIITRLMPDTSNFGISDMSTTVVSFGCALAIMGMYDAMYRMFFEKYDEEYRKDICSTTLMFTMASSAVIFVIMILLKDFIAYRFFGSALYNYLVYITAIATLVGATNSIVAAPTRMQNNRRIYLLMNTITPLLSYSISIPLLLKGYYVIALPVAGMITGFSGEIVFYILNHKWFDPRRFNTKYLKQMLAIAVPLLPNFLIYWIFNSSDKLMITNLIGTGATGIYSVGAKLGNASQLIYIAFSGGWQFFAFSIMKDKDQVKTNSRIFEYLGMISFGCTMFVFALCEPIYYVLFTGDYASGYIVSPYLFLAPLLQMLYQVACNQFLVIKKTWPNVFILSTGAIVNVFLNFFLIPKMGIEGAAISTLIGYIVSDVIVVFVLKHMNLIEISGRFLTAALLMVIFILLWRFVLKSSTANSFIAAVIIMLVYTKMYINDLNSLLKQIKKGNKKER